MKKASREKTIVDIANQLNISIATVSRALSDFPYVKEATRKKVLETAKQFGYQRNILASSLRNNKTQTIGLIVPRISMYFHAAVITTIQNKLFEHGYNLLICQSNDSIDIEQKLVRTLYNSRVDGVIASSTLHTTDFSHFDVFVRNDTPLIFYDRVPMVPYPALSITGDEYAGGYEGIKQLAEAGCKRIAYISGPQTCYLYDQRTKGAMAAFKDHNLKLAPSYFICNDLSYESAIKAMEFLFSKKQKPDGIFMSNDTSAIAAIEYCRANGIDVPQQLKVVGYSNDPRSAITTPSISSIDQSPETVGNKIVKELLSLLKTGVTSKVSESGDIDLKYPAHMDVPIKFVARASSAKETPVK